MQSQHLNIRKGQFLDQTSNSKFRIQKGHIVVQNLETGSQKRYLLPPLKFKNEKTTFGLPLKFLTKNQNVQLNPTGNILICKSLTFQQVQMSRTYSKDIAYWQLYLPYKCTSFSVGVKSSGLKKSHAFDFSINKPSHLTFKLDLESKFLACWIDGVRSQWHKPIPIENDTEWTPFVRVKNLGTQLVLNSLVSDPQSNCVTYINSQKKASFPEYKEPIIQEQEQLQTNDENYHLLKMSKDKIILVGENHIKLISRLENDQQFDFSFTQVSKNNEICVPLSQREFQIIDQFSKKINYLLLCLKLSKSKNENGYMISGTETQWSQQISSTLRKLNQVRQNYYENLKSGNEPIFNQISLQQVDDLAKIILTKADMANPYLSEHFKINSLYSEFNNKFNNVEPLPFFDQITTSFTVPKNIQINNYPFIKFNSQIISVKTAGQNYIACLLKDGNRVSIINTKQVPFKVIDTIISRGFIKETEINQYKKQVQDINDSDFTKPHIFKILKNCLKYADKVKPPEKLLKQIEKKKSEIQQKSKPKQGKLTPPSLQADKNLLDSLVSMGFNQKLSKKVLIESKNQSIEAALELILSKYPHENEQTNNFKGETKNKPKRQWQCQFCTLINSKDSLTCSACDNLVPQQHAVQYIQMMEEKGPQQEVKQQQGDKQILSTSIDNETVKDIFIWNTQVAYCPVLIAAIFETKIRFRLLGPNPKFYSNFYIKDNGYFDMTALKYNEFAHQISQSQINEKFFIGSSAEEQKRLHWGWMNIQDWDFDLNGHKEVSLIKFDSIKMTNKQHKFSILLHTQKSEKTLNCQILIDNVFEERKRCLIVKEFKELQQQKKLEINLNEGVLQKKDDFIMKEQMIFSSRSIVVCNFAKKINITQGKQQKIQQEQKPSTIQNLNPVKSDILSLIAISGPYSSTLNYPSCKLESISQHQFNSKNQIKNGLVFRHLNNCQFEIRSVQFERQLSQHNEEKIGYFYVVNDLRKEPVKKHEFAFNKEESKTVINLATNSYERGLYFVVVLSPTKTNSSRQILTSIAVYGEEVPLTNSNNCTQVNVTEHLKDLLKVQFCSKDGQVKTQQWKQLVTIECQLINYPIDLETLQNNRKNTLIHNLIHNTNLPIDLRLKIEPKNSINEQLTITSIKLQSFTLLSSHTHFKKQSIKNVSEQQYTSALLSFFLTNDSKYFDFITQQQNLKRYKKIVENIQLEHFIQNIIISQYKGKQFAMLKKFINLFADQLGRNKTLSNQDDVKNAIKSDKLTPSGAQILFELIKLLKNINLSSILQEQLNMHLNQISLKKKKVSSVLSSKYPSQNYHKEQTIFSSLLHRLSKCQQKSVLEQQTAPMYHFICQKHPQGRKLIIDMMSSYKVQEIELKFADVPRNKQKLIIEVGYVKENGQQVITQKRFIQENVWSQLLFSQQGKKVSKMATTSSSPRIVLNYLQNPIESRYIIINLTFTIVPVNSALKDQNGSTSIQVIPLVRGFYLGESEPILQQVFEFTESLSSVHDNSLKMNKRVQSFVKYSHIKDEKLLYYTSAEQLMENEDQMVMNKNISQLRKREQSPQNKQAIVKYLLKSPSQNNLNYNFTMGHLLVNALLDNLDRNNAKLTHLIQENTVELLIQHFINHQRGHLMQKSVHLIKKLIQTNKNIIKKVLSSKISTENLFNTIFKDLKVNQNPKDIQIISQLVNCQIFIENRNLSVNLSWLAKLFTFQKEFVQNLVKAQYQSGYLEQSAMVFSKYGWTQSTVEVLNSLIKQNKKERIPTIISSSRSTKQLVQFGFEQLKLGNQQVFELVIGELGQKSRHTNINDIENIVLYMIDRVESEEEYESEKREVFLSILGLMNRFGSNSKIVLKVIEIFFRLQQRKIYLNHLLGCQFIKEKQSTEMLLSTTFTKITTKQLKAEQLTLVSDILAFMLSKQVNLQTQSISFKLQKMTEQNTLDFFSNYLFQALNIGGLESAKMTNQLSTIKIKIAFYLSSLLQSEQVFSGLKEQQLSNLIYWLLVNITTKDEKHPKTPNCNRFLKIQQTVWKILQQKAKSQHQLFAKVYIQNYKLTKSKITQINNETIKNQCLQKLYIFNTQLLEKFNNQEKLLEILILQNGLFEQVLQQFLKIDTKNIHTSTEINHQQQLVNQLSTYPDPKLKPNDWLVYKNGSKNHVYKIQYFKNTQQQVELTLFHEEEFTLSKILFAFKLQSGNEKNICLPKSISVESGITMDKLRFLGQMFEVKDDRYYNLSTKIYGLNMNILKEKVSLEKQYNKNLPIKYLRFKIRAPQPISIEDVLEGAEIMELQNKVSLVNFLSIQGYKNKPSQSNTKELVKFLELLTLPQHKSLIHKLFNTVSVSQQFKLSLNVVSELMKIQHLNKILHNFLMRVCQQNTSIGNQMLEKYLKLENSQICSKISTEIVLSNDQQLRNRVILMHNFIEQVINEQKCIKEQIFSFMNRFVQVVYYTMTRQSYLKKQNLTEIPLKVSQKTLNKLLTQLKQTSEQCSQVISKFVLSILTLKNPFSVTGFELNDVLVVISERKNIHFDRILSSLVISNDECRKWFMSNQMLNKIFNDTFSLINNTKDIQLIVRNMALLTTLASNSSIKQLINKYQYNLKFFELLMGRNSPTILSAPENQSLRKSFVDLISRTSLGSENQAIIGQLLKDSIPNIISEGNEKFVSEIFLPLLNSFEKIPICVLPYIESENKLITDFSNVDFRDGKIEQKKGQNKAQNSGFRLPSSLVSEQAKQKIFEELKKNSYQNGKFNLAVSHGNYSQGLGQAVRNNVLFSNRPFMIIYELKSFKNVNHKRTICVFYNPVKDLAKTMKMKWTKGSFIMFIEKANEEKKTAQKIILRQSQPQNQNQFIQLENFKIDSYDHEENLVFYCDGKQFGAVTYSFQYENCFYFSELKIFEEQKSYDQWTVQSAEYWLFYSTLQSNKQKSSQVQEKSTLPELTKSLLQTNYDHTLFSNTHKASNSLNTLRYEPVYEFPSSLTIRQLKESMRIINCSIDQKRLKDLKLTIKIDQITTEITDDMTLQDIRKLIKSKNNIILDLNVHVDNLLNVLNLKSPLKRQEIDFLPRKGILKYFQENQGIQAMIKVIKKSIEGWKNKLKMQKWLQYVTELENFSHFPHFFAIYLKDKQTFGLLFNLLAGLPDKQTDPKWDALQASSSRKLLRIVSQILHMDKTSQFREYALKNSFFITILERLRILTGMFKRKFDKDFKEDQQQQKSPTKAEIQDDGTKKIKKKKGVGYGNDASSNTKWMKNDNAEERRKQFEIIQTILQIIQNFLDVQTSWRIPDLLLENIYESALLPFIEDGLRAGTLLEISKHPEKFKAIFNIIKVLSRHQQLIPVLLPIDQRYQPKQIQSIESLLKSLENISSIFLSCLTQSKTAQTADQKMSAQLATLIKETYKSVEQAIDDYKEHHMNDDTQQKQLEEILELSLDKKYRLLMKDLRFDYIDMKQTPSKIKHHYSSSFNPNYTPNQVKMIRLAQQLADISTALPHEHTNAIYVRCDKDRVDFMQALIMGSNGTPYGHGAFLFDVYFDDNYPNNPPKVNLTTTGQGKVRFNPNLYACGKVCLSLLGTWRGSASENWDAKVSTLLQVLLSIQAIIMSQEIYFNEPGFENQQGTQEGEKKNEAYSNIVRYCNIKYAMIDNIRKPPKGFETVIRRHFYLKKDEIMQECRKWQKYAQKRPANYIGLVNDHNHSWSNQFKKSKTQYKQMLDKAIQQLEQQLNKLAPPKITDIITTKQSKKQTKKKVTINKIEQLEKQQSQQQIDVSYDKSLLSTQSKQIDITDQKVKDRWSRYIGAMGIDAVSKQSKADILVFGLNPLALQTIKNLVLSGCRRLTICDDKLVTLQDLAGGFFYSMQDVGKKRIESILYKIRELNAYVKIDTIPSFGKLSQTDLKTYSLILATEISLSEQLKISKICRQLNIKFISADCIGFTGRIVNDLGQKFEVLDKNGQQPVQVFIKQITNAQKGIVTLLDGVKNPFEDGQAVLIRNVEGMKLMQDEKDKSINETIHKVRVINSKSFEIGNTLGYTPYIRNGTVKNIKTPVQISYKPFEQIVLDHKNVSVDENLAFYDFSKLQNSKIVKCCYLAIEEFREKNQTKYPEPWNQKDMTIFVDIFNSVYGEIAAQKTLAFVQKFTLTARGYLPPLCAFFGGLVCQQIIKAITQKFKPINSQFYIQFNQIVPELPKQINEQSLRQIFSLNKTSRQTGLQIVVGNELVQSIRNSKLFMIGSGAIGCELLKNFAMIGFGTGEKGKITLTDPDHIQNSNLNRQFLFRQKHISKSKSRTASEAVKIMNPGLKNHITALTERVSDSTKDIFTNKFFEGLTLVANALDNVAARRYVDQRCVQNKIPLFQSGTLGPKGHVQVIIPYLTESYGSQNDPVEQGQIPHCTLKMFPQQTLHCVEWARDIFGKKFSLQPKALIKIIDKAYKPQKDDIKSLNECVTMVKKCPKTFEDCINYAILKFYKYYRDDVMQLLYTYPLDAKTKNGEPFWKLPKRPPTPIMQFNPQDILQCTFVASLAVMVAKIYQIDYPKNFRSQSQRLYIGKLASKVKINPFVPSDQKAKEILKESSEKKQQNAEELKIEEVIQEKDQNELYKEIITTGGHQFKIKVEQFQKDDDSNGHIDFIYSMANLRAINYKLDQMDWITVKIKAGRIVPALATTTACVSGLQTLEICKYLKKIKIDLMKNSYLNLAVPSIQMSEPGQVQKKKITQKLTVNLWDRWEVVCQKSSTFGDLYEKLLKTYEIFPIGILQGMSRVDTGKSQQARKQFLKEKILDKLDLEDNYIDIIVLFTKSQEDDKIIQGVPPIRLLFN